MKVAIMQPYFVPYIGYFQLINAVDLFVLYDNIQFTKRGWVQRNRILNNGIVENISIPIRKDSDYLNINQRFLATNFQFQIKKIMNKIKNNYQKTSNYDLIFSTIEECLITEKDNLFQYLLSTITEVLKLVDINKSIINSSSINIDHSLRGKDKIIAICNELKADVYINPIGGNKLYNKKDFQKNNIELQFIKPILKPYKQISKDFISALSIIDVLFNNNESDINILLNSYGKI